jgi:dTDP-4-dehydrorhamnose reductase
VARLLVTGASGLLGANLLFAASSKNHQVIGVYHEHPIREIGWRSVACELNRPHAAEKLMDEERPDWVIHCAAATVLDRCERDRDWAYRMNCDMARSVAVAARLAGARLIHISTDAVFGAGDGPFDEQQAPSPPNIYAASKLAGEAAVQEVHPQAVIVRTNIIGWGPDPEHGLAGWVVERLRINAAVPGFDDVAFSPISAGLLAGILLNALEKGLSGLYHIAGATCLTKYDFALKLAEALGLDTRLVSRSSIDRANLVAPRGRQLCLDGARIEAALGIRLPEIHQSIARLREEWESGFAAMLHGLKRFPSPAEGASPGRGEDGDG